MSIRVPRAGLCLTALLGLSATLSAKPPDLPLPFQDTVAPKVQGEGGFVNDLFPMSPGGGEEGEAKSCPQAGPVYRMAPMARPMFQLPPSVRRSLTECVLFGVHPLMLLVPVGECLDAPCDHPQVAPATSLEHRPLLTRFQVQENQTGSILYEVGVNGDAGLMGSIVLIDEKALKSFRGHLGIAVDGTDGCPPQFSRKLWAMGRDHWIFRNDPQIPCSPAERPIPVELVEVGLAFAESPIGRVWPQKEAKSTIRKEDDCDPGLQSWWEALVLRLPEQNVEGEADKLPIFLGLLNGDYNHKNPPEPIKVMPKKEGPTKEREIEYQLSQPVTLNFSDTPLKQVIDDLRSWQGIHVYLDQEALDAEGISIDRPVTIKLQDVALKTALTLLLKQAHLTYVVKDDVLQITTEAEARGKLMTRTYPVADLIDADASALLGMDVPPWIKLNKEETLVSFITYNVLPRSWADVGGKASIEFHSPTQSLVVNQTPDGQEEVENVLALVRKQTKEAQDRKKEAEKQRERAVAVKPARIVRVNVVVPKNDPRMMEVVRKAVVEARKDSKAKLCVIVDGKVVGEEACEEEQEPRAASKAAAKPYRAEGRTCPSRAKGVAAAEDKAAGLHFADLLDQLGHVFKEGGCAEVGIGSNGLRFRGQFHVHGNTYHLRFGGAGGVCVWTMSHPAEKTEDAQQEK
jgi:hypothetical protein